MTFPGYYPRKFNRSIALVPRKLWNMDKQSELLMRSALHDMANVMAGVQGILDLADPDLPLSARNRERLTAVVEEGMATLGRTRHLAMGTLPEPQLQDGAEWRAQLADELGPLSILFRCRIEVTSGGGTGTDRWPVSLRSYLRAAIRHALPYAQGGVLTIEGTADAEAWRLCLRPVTVLPEGLLELPEGKPGDICGRWARSLGEHLGLVLSCEDEGLTLRMPRT